MIEEYYLNERSHIRPYTGQLDDSFQTALREAYQHVGEDDCHFYHTLDLGGGRVVPGGWDIRGYERSYLGHIQYDKLSVMEFGPASGFLSFWMEREGADVTVFELAPGLPPDLVPLPGVDLEANAKSGDQTAQEVRNSWWYAHRETQSKARAVYGDIYRLPSDMGRYDVTTFGSILLLLGKPFAAMSEAAKITDKAMVITDMIPDVIYGQNDNSLIEFNPGNEGANLVNWWRFSPAAITKMLHVLGFPHVDIHRFEAIYHPHHDPTVPASKRFMFTAVGLREGVELPRIEKTSEELAQHQHLCESVPHISLDAYNDAHRRLQESQQELSRIYRSLPWKLTKPLRMLLGK